MGGLFLIRGSVSCWVSFGDTTSVVLVEFRRFSTD